MTDHKNIYMALAAAQANMGPVAKGSINPHFNSAYADLADVMRVAVPALTAEGIAPWHSVVNNEGTHYMRTTLSHGATDTHIVCDVQLLVGKGDMQGMKSATTYAKRIGIESLTGIAPEDDDGNAAAKAPVVPAQRQKAAPYSPQKNAAPQHYPDDEFAKNFPKWKTAIEAGNLDIKTLVANTNTKGGLSAEQQAKVATIKAKAGEAA